MSEKQSLIQDASRFLAIFDSVVQDENDGTYRLYTDADLHNAASRLRETLGASESRLRDRLHARRGKLALVTSAVISALMRPIRSSFADDAASVDIARNDSLHTDILSVESNAGVSEDNR